MNKNNDYLLVCVLKILKHKITKANSAQTKSSLIFAHNLVVYALRGDTNTIEQLMEREGVK